MKIDDVETAAISEIEEDEIEDRREAARRIVRILCGLEKDSVPDEGESEALAR